MLTIGWQYALKRGRCDQILLPSYLVEVLCYLSGQVSYGDVEISIAIHFINQYFWSIFRNVWLIFIGKEMTNWQSMVNVCQSVMQQSHHTVKQTYPLAVVYVPNQIWCVVIQVNLVIKMYMQKTSNDVVTYLANSKWTDVVVCVLSISHHC